MTQPDNGPMAQQAQKMSDRSPHWWSHLGTTAGQPRRRGGIIWLVYLIASLVAFTAAYAWPFGAGSVATANVGGSLYDLVRSAVTLAECVNQYWRRFASNQSAILSTYFSGDRPSVRPFVRTFSVTRYDAVCWHVRFVRLRGLIFCLCAVDEQCQQPNSRFAESRHRVFCRYWRGVGYVRHRPVVARLMVFSIKK